jgi:hypothetical protein
VRPSKADDNTPWSGCKDADCGFTPSHIAGQLAEYELNGSIVGDEKDEGINMTIDGEQAGARKEQLIFMDTDRNYIGTLTSIFGNGVVRRVEYSVEQSLKKEKIYSEEKKVLDASNKIIKKIKDGTYD